MHSQFYTKSFYEQMRNGSRQSAEVIVPLVLQLLTVRSVVDVGCGDGNWLVIFQKYGVDEILGIDGDYVDRELLQIPQDHFQTFDLTKPFSLGRVFDLAISLEVAEHLPPECADAFVESLIQLAPVVLFSAAIPFQGGTDHINEQWPDKWAGLFKKHGYVTIDFIRKRVWQNDAVEFWYAQNALLFAQGSLLENNSFLKAEFEQTCSNQLRLVHPRQFLHLQNLYQNALEPPFWGVRGASRLLLTCLRDALFRRVRSMLRKEPLSRTAHKSGS